MIQIDWSALPEWVNEAYKPYFLCDSRFLIIYGGAGSGKSFAIAQRIVFKILDEPGHNWLVLRKWGVTNSRSTFALIRQVISSWGLGDFFEVNKSSQTITCLPTGGQIAFGGLDDSEKLKSLTFASGALTDVWIEEASEISLDDFTQVNLRLRGQALVPFQIVLSFNPVSIHSWLKVRFFDSGEPEAVVLRTTYKDNRFVDEAYRKELERLTGTAHRVYALGEWGVAEGLVFSDFEIGEIPAGAKPLGVGLDWGYSVDPTAAVMAYETPTHWVLDELLYSRGLLNSVIYRELKAAGVGDYDTIIADSAEPKSIDELYSLGLKGVKPCLKGQDSVRSGLAKMMEKKLLITPRSLNLQRELSAYSWKKTKDGKTLPEPEGGLDHILDASRYIVNYPRKSFDIM